MISWASKQGAGRANLRKREKTNGLLGLNSGCGLGQPKEKEKRNGLVVSKIGGWVGQPKETRENEWINRG